MHGVLFALLLNLEKRSLDTLVTMRCKKWSNVSFTGVFERCIIQKNYNLTNLQWLWKLNTLQHKKAHANKQTQENVLINLITNAAFWQNYTACSLGAGEERHVTPWKDLGSSPVGAPDNTIWISPALSSPGIPACFVQRISCFQLHL